MDGTYIDPYSCFCMEKALGQTTKRFGSWKERVLSLCPLHAEFRLFRLVPFEYSASCHCPVQRLFKHTAFRITSYAVSYKVNVDVLFVFQKKTKPIIHIFT